MRERYSGAGASPNKPAKQPVKASPLRQRLLEELRAVRLARGMSFRMLALHVRVSATLLILIEQGKREASVELMREWCEALEVGPELRSALQALSILHHGNVEDRLEAAQTLSEWERRANAQVVRTTVGVESVQRCFEAAFQTKPTHVVVAPGRVNLIGEHIDYNGLSVLPMALDRAVTILVRVRTDGRVRVANVDARYPTHEFVMARQIPLTAAGGWGNYLQAAAQLVAQRATEPCLGADLCVAGDVPEAAGLSSSSALVVGVTLALLAVQQATVPRLELMELCAQAERYVGVSSGGMDQAICLGGRLDHAVKIGFAPLRLEAAPLPSEWRFVVAHSGVSAHKAGRAKEAYNTRVRECAEALQRLCAVCGLDVADGWKGLLRARSSEDLVRLAETRLPALLAKRSRHVLTEAQRVDRAVQAMAQGDARAFGSLMDASHASLRDDYEVSCPELDELVELARAQGAVGARLTGAGFGGCMVALTTEAQAHSVAEGLRRDWQVARGLPEASVLVARASRGASVQSL
jgi:galactokinase